MSMRVYEEDVVIRHPEEYAGMSAKFVAFRCPAEWHGMIYVHDGLWKTWVTPLTNTNKQRPGVFDLPGGEGEREFLMYARLHTHFQHDIVFDYTDDERGLV